MSVPTPGYISVLNQQQEEAIHHHCHGNDSSDACPKNKTGMQTVVENNQVVVKQIDLPASEPESSSDQS